MIKKIKEIASNQELIRYGIIGAMTQVIDLLTFALLVNVGVHYIVADFINNPLSLGFNYIGHKYFTFNSKKWDNLELGRYLLNLVFNYFYTTVILIIFIDVIGVPETLGKASQIVAVILINFLILKRFVFKKSKINENVPPTV